MGCYAGGVLVVVCGLWFGEGRGEGGYQPRKRTLVLGCEGTWCRRRRREAGVAAMVVLVFCVFTNTINSTRSPACYPQP